MKGKFMIIAALLGALTFGACVDSEESASVTAVRNAKAEQLKSVATLNNAKAQAEATLAAAEAQLAAAQAQLLAAEAAALNAATEEQKIANQIAAANAQAEIARIQAQMELDLIKYQADLKKAQAKFNKEAQWNLAYLNNEYVKALDHLAEWQYNLANAKLALAEAEAAQDDAAARNEALYNYYVGLYAQAVADIDAAEAKIEALGELSVMGEMTSQDEADAYIRELEEAASSYAADAEIAAAAEAAAKKNYEKAANNGNLAITAKKHAYSTAYVDFKKYYNRIINDITANTSDSAALPTKNIGKKSATDMSKGSYTYEAFNVYKWDITADNGVTNLAVAKTVELFKPAFTDSFDYFGQRSLKSNNYDSNSSYKGNTKQTVNGVGVVIPTFEGRVFYYDIVADNVEVYAESVENYISMKYDAALASAELKVELIEDQINQTDLEESVENIMADYEMVVEAIAETEVALEEAQRELAALKSFYDTYYDADDFEDEDNNSGLTDDTWEDYSEQVAELEEQIAELKAFLNEELTEDFIEEFNYEYANKTMNAFDGLYKTQEKLESLFDGDVEDGLFIGASDKKDLIQKWFTAVEELADLEEKYETMVGYAESAVAALETMVAEYDSWVEFAINGYNAPRAAYLEAKVATLVAQATSEAYAAKANQVWKVACVMFIDGFADTLQTSKFLGEEDTLTPEQKAWNAESEANLNAIAAADYAGKIAAWIAGLEEEIAIIEDAIYGTDVAPGIVDMIEMFDPATYAIDAAYAIAQAKNLVAKAEAQVATWEANLAVAKAALEAALAE